MSEVSLDSTLWVPLLDG